MASLLPLFCLSLEGRPPPGLSEAVNAYELGSRRLNLEKLFVPIHVVPCRSHEEENAPPPSLFPDARRDATGAFGEIKPAERLFFGELLATTSRIALLAPPGGGKSTLLKRLALAYAVPKRHQQINDRLPKKNWLPLLLRCRELKTRATDPFGEILAALAERAEMKDQQKEFLALVNAAVDDRSLLPAG
jgi:hypothetical protein